MLLLHRCALRKFHVTDGQNKRDQVAMRNDGTYTRRMRTNNLEIRIASSSCFARNNDKNNLITKFSKQ